MTTTTTARTSRLFYIAEDGFARVRHLFVDDAAMFNWLDISAQEVLDWKAGQTIPPAIVLSSLLHLAYFGDATRRFHNADLPTWASTHDDALGSTPLEAVKARRGADAVRTLEPRSFASRYL